MNRTIFAGSLASIIILLIGTFAFPASMLMWLASISLPYTIFRVIMVGALVGVLLTNPPRRRDVRAGMGALSLILISCGLALALGNSVHLLDILLFMELGFAFGLEALEFNEEELDERIMRLQHPERYQEDVRTLGSLIVQKWQELRTRNSVDWQVV